MDNEVDILKPQTWTGMKNARKQAEKILEDISLRIAFCHESFASK